MDVSVEVRSGYLQVLVTGAYGFSGGKGTTDIDEALEWLGVRRLD
jgi:hypothetical protein